MKKLLIVVFFGLSLNMSFGQSRELMILFADIKSKYEVKYIEYEGQKYLNIKDTLILTLSEKTVQYLNIKIGKKIYYCNLEGISEKRCEFYKLKVIQKKMIKKSKFSSILVFCTGENVLSGLLVDSKKSKIRKCIR